MHDSFFLITFNCIYQFGRTANRQFNHPSTMDKTWTTLVLGNISNRETGRWRWHIQKQQITNDHIGPTDQQTNQPENNIYIYIYIYIYIFENNNNNGTLYAIYSTGTITGSSVLLTASAATTATYFVANSSNSKYFYYYHPSLAMIRWYQPTTTTKKEKILSSINFFK